MDTVDELFGRPQITDEAHEEVQPQFSGKSTAVVGEEREREERRGVAREADAEEVEEGEERGAGLKRSDAQRRGKGSSRMEGTGSW